MQSSGEQVDVVILAGGPGFGTNAVPKAMTSVAGKTMLQWEVDALRQSVVVSKIYAVGQCHADGLDEVLPPTKSFLGNMISGVTRAKENGADMTLVATSDIPLITPVGIRDFIERALELGADFCYPIIPKKDCTAYCPEIRRTYLRLKEGTFSGGNMVLVSVEFILRNHRIIEQAYDARKSVSRLARMIGLGTLIRVLAAQLICPSAVDLPILEKAASRILGGEARVVVTSYAEIGQDVDRADDLPLMDEILSGRHNIER